MAPADAPIVRHFSIIEDPRLPGHSQTVHKLIDVVVIGVCAAMCGIDDFEHMEQWATAKEPWLRTFLELPHGIPSHNTLNRLFGKINPAKFQDCFLSWMTEITTLTKGTVIAIDGKALRGSFDKASAKSAVYMVSAFASANGIVLGQVKVDDKSNEITAIPKLLDALDVAGCIITIDAMGTQREIATKIVAAGGDYTLALKENQPSLFAAVVAKFEEATTADAVLNKAMTRDRGHGRLEARDYFVISDIEDIQSVHKWPGLESIGMVKSIRVGDGKIGEETRYFLNSYNGDQFPGAVRQHWGIENKLHWSLDASAFDEDKCRVRKDHGPENLAVLRHMALNIAKRDTVKGSARTKQLRCILNQDHILNLLIS
jgi:predicted transposase YbfD/YdcC